MTAARALRSLETLAQARDLDLTERRREAALLQERLARTDQTIAAVKAAVAEEARAIDGDPVMQAAYARFAANARTRVVQLEGAREALAAEIDQADERIMEAFRALKQVEEAAEARRREIAEELARKERAQADDLAGVRASRID